MTHFGFQNVPEAQKESLGRFIGDILHIHDRRKKRFTKTCANL